MNEAQLKQLNIFALRELARHTGVPSPTSKKKDVLIEEIMAIREGKKKPHIAKTKQGRPPKDFGYEFIDVIKVRSNPNIPSSIASFKQEVPEFVDEDSSSVCGYVELLDNGAGLLWVVKKCKTASYYISPKYVEQFNLKFGDKVIAELDLSDNQTIVSEILNINNTALNDYSINRAEYDNLKFKSPTDKLKFDANEYNTLDIYKGENVYIYGDNNSLNTEKMVSLINNCKIQHKIYINVSVADKNKYLIDQIKDAEMFISSFTSETQEAKRIVLLAMERAKRLLEKGEEVAVFVDDLLSLMGIENGDNLIIKQVVTLSKNIEGAGSISLLAIVPISTLYAIEKLADKRLKIENNNILLK